MTVKVLNTTRNLFFKVFTEAKKILERNSLFQGKNPLGGEDTEHVGCVYCDPVLRPLIEKHHAMARRSNRGRGGGRGGRGGRGRGRGRGRGKPKDKMAQLAAYFV